MDNSSALLVVDVQNDFCPGGALAVPEGDKVVPVLNRYIDCFVRRNSPVILTRDWHPPETTHFKEFGGIWPAHCIQGTAGAKYHPDLKPPAGAIIVSKGKDPKSDDYSAFQAVTREGRSLKDILDELGVRQLFIGGLATDYCVKESVMEGLKEGFSVSLLEDAIAGVDLSPGDSGKAISEMHSAGARRATLKDLCSM